MILSYSPQSATELIVRAIGFEPEGSRGDTAETCALCGQGIAPGELRERFKPSESFTDGFDLAGPVRSARMNQAKPVNCGYCVIARKKYVLSRYSAGVYCEKGYWLFYKAETLREKYGETRPWPDNTYRLRAALLLNPPDGQWAWTEQTSSHGQNLIWRAPLNMTPTTNPGVYRIRHGTTVLTLRHGRFMEAVDALSTLMAEGAPKPFYRLQVRKTSEAHAKPNKDFPWNDPRARPLRMLGPGELWALAAIPRDIHKTRDELFIPEPLTKPLEPTSKQEKR
jgi:hypothetical protein